MSRRKPKEAKLMIWPRRPLDGPQGPVYRYAVVGMIVTDKPVEEFEGKNEVYLDGETYGHVLERLACVASHRPARRVSTADDVLTSLDSL